MSAVPRYRCSQPRRYSLAAASRWLVGSSKSKSRGLTKSAAASATLIFHPPLSARTEPTHCSWVRPIPRSTRMARASRAAASSAPNISSSSYTSQSLWYVASAPDPDSPSPSPSSASVSSSISNARSIISASASKLASRSSAPSTASTGVSPGGSGEPCATRWVVTWTGQSGSSRSWMALSSVLLPQPFFPRSRYLAPATSLRPHRRWA
mmetsp:Transcript_13047/g.54786  ORF Transcript_13047/g.54786 Transcript_13047/m.54786 type:complete len:209 (-) Transcript_13047:168-794(-)